MSNLSPRVQLFLLLYNGFLTTCARRYNKHTTTPSVPKNHSPNPSLKSRSSPRPHLYIKSENLIDTAARIRQPPAIIHYYAGHIKTLLTIHTRPTQHSARFLPANVHTHTYNKPRRNPLRSTFLRHRALGTRLRSKFIYAPNFSKAAAAARSRVMSALYLLS